MASVSGGLSRFGYERAKVFVGGSSPTAESGNHQAAAQRSSNCKNAIWGVVALHREIVMSMEIGDKDLKIRIFVNLPLTLEQTLRLPTLTTFPTA